MISIGDYVRTSYGIGKIDKIRHFMNVFEFHLDSNKGRIHNVTENTYWNSELDIIGKPSDNLASLVRPWDIVNLANSDSVYRVLSLPNEEDKDVYLLACDANFPSYEDVYVEKSEFERTLTGVLTKEQFERECYYEDRSKNNE